MDKTMHHTDEKFLPLSELVDLLENVSPSYSSAIIRNFVEGGILGGGHTGRSIKIREQATKTVRVAEDIRRQRPQAPNRAADQFLNDGWLGLSLSERPQVSRPQKNILDECEGTNPRYEISVQSAVAFLNGCFNTDEFNAALPTKASEEKNKGGRPEKYDYDRWYGEAFLHFKERFIPENQRVPTENEVLDWSKDWFEVNTDENGDVPRRSEVRKRIPPLIKSLENSFIEASAIIRR